MTNFFDNLSDKEFLQLLKDAGYDENAYHPSKKDTEERKVIKDTYNRINLACRKLGKKEIFCIDFERDFC